MDPKHSRQQLEVSCSQNWHLQKPEDPPGNLCKIDEQNVHLLNLVLISAVWREMLELRT